MPTVEKLAGYLEVLRRLGGDRREGAREGAGDKGSTRHPAVHSKHDGRGAREATVRKRSLPVVPPTI